VARFRNTSQLEIAAALRRQANKAPT